MSNKSKSHREPSLVSPSGFARRKNTTIQAVRYHLYKTKSIEIIHIGMDKDVFIDWNEYKDFQFDNRRKK